MLILNTCSFEKKMLSNLTNLLYVLIYTLAKHVLEDDSESFAKLAEIYTMTEFTVAEGTVFRVTTF